MEWSEKRVFRSYFAAISLVAAASLAVCFAGLDWRNRELLRESMLAEARVLFWGIVQTRLWNAAHGGVYAEKTADLVPNPFLEHPEVRTEDGRTLVLINPATMTREISGVARSGGDISFRITSLKTINPANDPTPFEREALAAFNRGEKEFSRTLDEKGRRIFLYMAPLYTDESCLSCHARQGYKVGDARGGISVRLDVSGVYGRLESGTWIIAAVSSGAIALVVFLLARMTRTARARIEAGRARLKEMAETDELTGAANRRRLLERLGQEVARAGRAKTALSCIMIDIDHFKKVNDTLGHQAGDEALRAVARIIQGELRSYDMLGRLGGEEFLVVAPGLDCQAAEGLADRLRVAVSSGMGALGERYPGLAVTISLGVSSLRDMDESMDDVLRRADAALYAAKAAGRNRAEVC
jgi:diguanylate cyclase (GGDEF)-like protein